LIASFVGYALQFPVRGMLSGSHKTTKYSSIIAVEGVLRVALPLVLVVVGLTNPVAFAFVVAVAAAMAVVPVLMSRDRSWLEHDHAAGRVFASRVARLVVAAFSIQLLLNSGTLLARGFGEGTDALLAGQILACLSIARIPVFGYQVLQILYLPRLAAEWKAKNAAGVRSILATALVAAALVGAAIVSVMGALGQWAIGLLFDAELVLAQEGIVVVSLGVSIFILALVASDGAIAIGKHTLVLTSWLVAVILAAIPALLISDTLLRVTAPLIVGSTAALVQLGIGVLRSYSLRFPRKHPAASNSSRAADHE
jgi:O-antigen/teichoic acid export membrane protein